MTGRTGGILALVAACVMWGLSPILYRYLDYVPAWDVMAHRSFWSVIFFVGLILAQRRGVELGRAVASRQSAGLLAIAAVMIGINWLVFIVSAQHGHLVEASLGYYIYPLVAVLLGRIVFGDRPTGMQMIAVGSATIGVSVLTVGLGSAPWISLLLAVTFAIYGALKRGITAHPLVSVTIEVLFLAPVAIAWILWHEGAGFFVDLPTALLLIATGPVTALPLVLFTLAARRLNSATLGILFYLNPTLQFVVGTMLFSEPFTIWHRMAFPLIWGAVAIYSVALVRGARRARRRERAASVSGTV